MGFWGSSARRLPPNDHNLALPEAELEQLHFGGDLIKPAHHRETGHSRFQPLTVRVPAQQLLRSVLVDSWQARGGVSPRQQCSWCL